MKIVRITYRENRASVENKFLHQHVELTAELNKNDTVDKAMAKLQAEARRLLYPELDGLRQKLTRLSAAVGKCIEPLTDAQLATFYTLNPTLFNQFAEGKISPVMFLRGIQIDPSRAGRFGFRDEEHDDAGVHTPPWAQ